MGTQTLLFFILGFLSISLRAQTLQSYCHTAPASAQVLGQNIDKRLPIASVSKLVTSYWAIKTVGPDFQYTTGVHVTPVSRDLYDLHLEGARDPYFGQEKLHFMISELNKRGIKKIRTLSFDEQFLFLQDLDIVQNPFVKKGNQWVWYNWFRSPMTSQRTYLELQKGWLKNYPKTFAKAARNKIEFFKNPLFSVNEIKFIGRDDFVPQKNVLNFFIRSTKLIHLLKEMNRNSNNLAAVEIFKLLGGASEFAKFIQTHLKLGSESIQFHEGSGNRVAAEARYNEASCSALLKIFKALDTELQKSRLRLQDVMSVIGEDGLVNQGTPYSHDLTNVQGVAKTGTIDAAITLGGVLNSSPQKIYFMYNVKPKFPGEARASRQLVGREIKKLAKAYQDSMSELEYENTDFFSFEPIEELHVDTPRLN